MLTLPLRLVALALVTALSVAAAPAATTPSSQAAGARPAYEPTWAPAASAAVHPGTEMVTQGAQCTSNFIFAAVDTDPETGVETLSELYIGMAAHCAATGESTDTNGCLVAPLPDGTKVTIDGAIAPGRLAYSSWGAMRDRGEADGGACNGNDFALVTIHPADYGRVNPSLPFWGGPHGVNTTGVAQRTDLYSWGNSGLRFGREQTSPKIETKAATSNGGWTHVTYAMSPGIPGDSGSGHVDEQGRAFGVTSTLILLPQPAGNGISDLGRALDYARSFTGKDIRLVDGTEEFSGLL